MSVIERLRNWLWPSPAQEPFVEYVPLSAEKRALRIVEIERGLRRGGLREAAVRLVVAEDMLRYHQAIISQWQHIQGFRQFCADVKTAGHLKAGVRGVHQPRPESMQGKSNGRFMAKRNV